MYCDQREETIFPRKLFAEIRYVTFFAMSERVKLTPITTSQPTPIGVADVIPDLLTITPLTVPPWPYPVALIAM
jgi:hypothetical protein